MKIMIKNAGALLPNLNPALTLNPLFSSVPQAGAL